MSKRRKKRRSFQRRYQNTTMRRNGTEVDLRIDGAEKIVYYHVVAQGPYFLEDMAHLRATWTKGAGWQFVPRPNPR